MLERNHACFSRSAACKISAALRVPASPTAPSICANSLTRSSPCNPRTAVDVRSWALPGALCAAIYFAMSYPLARLAARLEARLEAAGEEPVAAPAT